MANILPQAFVGLATISEESAPDGTTVTAWLEGFGEPLAEATVFSGSFILTIPQYGIKSFTGKVLNFKIGDADAAETAVWELGGVELLNLSVTN